ncbi:phage terminase large subunit [Chryseobacterium vrystaatense]|uniref:Phage terminase, large subunit, PBSX family n=1 Tax=Chryseobacterium vrystaatense TaxID=307480 RepID=A0A1M4ZKG7_9FLAO|nr:phage terminase large subunit [Chryseobacterium vrystaatense]SHF18312.1 phage terminase, large subunit, PBSX family [Chryseobacterium vrystaatense]
MSLTDAEIVFLEQLIHDREVDRLVSKLTTINEETNPNYKLLFEAINGQKWGFNEHNRPVLLYGYSGVALEGSSRSGKTWSGVDIIIYLATIKHKKEGCTINIYRETYNEFKTTVYEDFKRRLDDYGLPNPFHNAKEVPSFRIGKTVINMLGDGKHGGGCDYAFFNEAMMISKSIFDQVKMRCRKFWWMDYNPSFTDHWVFDSVTTREDVAFLRTTFKDNPFISGNELKEILGYEPWLPGSYEVTSDNVLYNGQPISETNQPPPHPLNIDQGTADEFMWKVYGLGLRGAMKGVIFPQITWIDKFPEYYEGIYGNDFGFTSDPNAFGRYYEDENNIYLEPLLYESIETADVLGSCYDKLNISESDLIICDSSDKHVSEKNGTVQMVQDLINLGWNAMKVSKTKSVTYHLLSMKKKKIHIVKNHLYQKSKKEVENYKWREINGILINQPIDKYNHMWDWARYCHMAWNSGQDLEAEWN